MQDDWRATSWLTVNLGLRYDVFTPFTEEGGICPTSSGGPKILVAGQNGVTDTAGVNTDYSNIQPRLGFSASLAGADGPSRRLRDVVFPRNNKSPSYLKNPPFTRLWPDVSTAASNSTPNVRLADGLPPLAKITLDDPSGAVIATGLDFKSDRVSSST